MHGADDVAALQQGSIPIAHGGIPVGGPQTAVFLQQLFPAGGILEMQVADKPALFLCPPFGTKMQTAGSSYSL